MKYSYEIDFSKPYFLSKKVPIFDLTEETVKIAAHRVVDGHERYSDTKSNISSQLEVEAGLDGSYGCFGGRSSMAVGNSSDDQFHTARVDKVIRASKYSCQPAGKLAFAAHTLLDKDLVEYINDPSTSCEDLESTLGCFYVRSCTLGGVFQQSYTMQMVEGDNESKITAELQGEYGAALIKVDGSLGTTHKKRTSNNNADVKIELHCEGGEPTCWLGATSDSFTEVQKKWSETVSDENLFPYGYQLKPVWDLISKINPEKGELFEKHLLQKWADQNAGFNPSKYVQVDLRRDVVANMSKTYHGHLDFKPYLDHTPVTINVKPDGSGRVDFTWIVMGDDRRNVPHATPEGWRIKEEGGTLTLEHDETAYYNTWKGGKIYTMGGDPVGSYTIDMSG